MNKASQNRIVVDPEIMVGKPIVRGTRITVELILRQLAQGMTVGDILKNYPHLAKEDIYAAIQYATQLVQEEFVYPLFPKSHAKTKTLVG